MRIFKLNECGYDEALFGIGLSHGLTSDISIVEFIEDQQLYKRMQKIAKRLAYKQGGHNKFLESIVVWLDITAPRYWWQQFDTYRVGVTKQSESTMHTILKRTLFQEDFEHPIFQLTLQRLNHLIVEKDFDQLKEELPEGFLQRRVVCVNYKTLQNIVNQRDGHKSRKWQDFIDLLLGTVLDGSLIKHDEK